MKLTLLFPCMALAALSQRLDADTIKFKLLNNLKNNSIELARFVTKGASTDALNFDITLPKNGLTTSEGKRTYETDIDSDQTKQIYFKLSGSPTIYGYEIRPKGYKTVFLRVVDGPVIEPQTSLGRKISGNIESSAISNIGAPSKGQSPYRAGELELLKLQFAISQGTNENDLLAMAKDMVAKIIAANPDNKQTAVARALNQKDAQGATILMDAYGDWDLMLYLLVNGASASIKDNKGRTVSDIVMSAEKRNPKLKDNASFNKVKAYIASRK